MKVADVTLYGPIYKGVKVVMNSRKGRGMTVEGYATQVDEKSQLIIIRDKENFPHSIDVNYAKEVGKKS